MEMSTNHRGSQRVKIILNQMMAPVVPISQVPQTTAQYSAFSA